MEAFKRPFKAEFYGFWTAFCVMSLIALSRMSDPLFWLGHVGFFGGVVITCLFADLTLVKMPLLRKPFSKDHYVPWGFLAAITLAGTVIAAILAVGRLVLGLFGYVSF